MSLPPKSIDDLDHIIEETACRLSIEEIGGLVFGGLMGRPNLFHFLEDIIQAGIELRKRVGLPLAVPVPSEVGFFLVSWAVEQLADMRIRDGDMGIGKVRRRMDKIERRHGVDDALVPWPVDDGPPGWQAANREWVRISDQIFVETLRPFGADMADLFGDDLDEFDRRREVGRVNFARLIGRDDVLQRIEDALPDAPEEA